MLKAIFTGERMSRLMVSLLLCLGVLWPLLWALGIQSAFLMATLISAAVILLLTLSGADRRLRLVVLGAAMLFALVQLFLPRMGLFGQAVEAVKAFVLYLNGMTCAAPLYVTPLAVTLAVLAAFVSYLFSHKGAGFIPATVLLVLVLFGLWSLGKHDFFWFAAPGLVSLLLITSQSTHEKINLFEVLPMAAILVALAMVLTPGGKTVIEPLHKAAMELKETIADYLFFTEPRNVFTLGTYGYYPMGQGKLGGEAEPTEYPVMMVKTDRKTLLRGVVKDYYTGRNWQDTSSGRRLLYVHPGWRTQRAEVFQEDMPAQSVMQASDLLSPVTVSVQMRNKAASTLFAPVFLRDVNPQGSLIPYFNDSSELFATRDLDVDDRYSVLAPVFEGGDAALGALINAAPRSDRYYMEIYAKYTQLPGHLEPTLYTDLQNIVAGASTPYEQACAIQRHLQRYYRYTISPETPPENQDFVTYFLYVGKEGYCTYFASAMTVLSRMAGLPARYVEGFAAYPASDGIAYVTGLNAHAWTEIYFEGFGWVPFDATPSQQDVQQQNQPPQQPEPTPTPTPTPEPQEEPTPTPPENDPTPPPEHPDETPLPDMQEPEDEPQNDPPRGKWWLWLIALALLAALIVRIVLRTPARVAARENAVQDQLFVYGNAVAQVLRMRGYASKPGETPMRFARRMDQLPAAPVAITPLWRAMMLSNYSRKQPTAQLAQQAQETFRSVYQPQAPLLKLRFLLTAAFSNRFYRLLETPVEHVEPKRLYQLPGTAEAKKTKKTPAPKGGQAEQTRAEAQEAELTADVKEALSPKPETPKPAQQPPVQPVRDGTTAQSRALERSRRIQDATVQPPQPAAPISQNGTPPVRRRRRQDEP